MPLHIHFLIIKSEPELKMTFHPEADDVQSFDRRSRDYEDSFLHNVVFDWIHRDALDCVPAGLDPKNVLDIGCGTGRLLRKAAARWPNAGMIGVDPAPGMVNEGIRLNPHVQFYNCPAESIPLPDGSVDLVLSTLSFHHWQDQLQGVKEAARVMSHGGVFILVDLYLPWGLRQIIQHARMMNPSATAELFNTTNLNVIRQKRIMGHFLLATVGYRSL